MPPIRHKPFLADTLGALYAPPFPRFLTSPGFWDEAYVADLRFDRLFTALFLDLGGRPLTLVGRVESCEPWALVVDHSGEGIRIRETRCVAYGAYCSRFELLAGGPVQVVQWGLPEVSIPGSGTPWRSIGGVEAFGPGWRYDALTRWPKALEPDRSATEAEQLAAQAEMGQAVALTVALGHDGPNEGRACLLAQKHDLSPLWATSALPQLGRTLPTEVADGEGLLHLYAFTVLRPGEPVTLWAATGPRPHRPKHAPEEAKGLWEQWIASFPGFRSEDPFLENACQARVIGLGLNAVRLPVDPAPQALDAHVTEGIGFFRNFVTYSAQAHLRETVWQRTPALPKGILRSLAKVQRPDGSFPGHSYSARPNRDFYHADFATGAASLRALHPGAYDPEMEATLRRYAAYLASRRTPAGGVRVEDQNETGQEYMNRYQVVSEAAERWERFEMTGVDATVYGALLGAFLGDEDLETSCRRCLEGAMWDPEAGFFCDLDAEGLRTSARPATGLYALLVPGLSVEPARRWLADPGRFWLRAGFPAEAATEPTFNPEGLWRGRRLNCPWNGRSWPMANSHLVAGLARAARDEDPSLAPLAVQALQKAVRLFFPSGNPAEPTSYEHYNPLTGEAAWYRGYDAYMHSWVIDLLLRDGCGLVPGGGDARPLPLPGWVEFEGVPWGEEWISGRIVDGVASLHREPR